MNARTALAAAALLALGACSAEPAPAPTTSTEPPPTATESAGVSCADAPQDVVGEVLGLRLNHSRQAIRDNVVTCTYDGGGAEVRFTTGADAASFAARRAEHASTTDVPDLPDEAYRATTTSGEVVHTLVVARRGTVEVAVSSGANAARVQQLVSTLLAGL
ncbi:hypothetical protein [Saccharothrix syringae]|uniref:DUF3558 domain-containing protein n=1 Tax=Saccharothrix syringae TaxID=103733 RepID=A0A5Q0GV18_SACSY|nr:hypothetical protein [Saccharothrix syringae]QFZ17212.1 hypothetical protein EKG83_06800 [Saccharothrix syringae]